MSSNIVWFITFLYFASAALSSPLANRISLGDGIISDKGEFPFQASIFGKGGSKIVYKCGGVVISNRHRPTIKHFCCGW